MRTHLLRLCVGVLCALSLGALSACKTLPDFPTLEEVGTYLEDHPNDWEAHVRYANLIAIRSPTDPQVAAHLQTALRLLEPGWKDSTESRLRYLHLERDLLVSLSRYVPAAERLTLANQAFADSEVLPPEEKPRLSEDWELQTHLLRGQAMADLGYLDKSAVDLVVAGHARYDSWEMGDVPVQALKEAEALQLKLAALATTAGDAERATHAREVAARCHDEWTHEKARRDGIVAVMEAKREAQARHDHEATLAWEADNAARRKAEADRVADMVPCPVCHGFGYYDTVTVTTTTRRDGSTRKDATDTGSRRCNYCLDGWVSKSRAAQISQSAR